MFHLPCLYSVFSFHSVHLQSQAHNHLVPPPFCFVNKTHSFIVCNMCLSLTHPAQTWLTLCHVFFSFVQATSFFTSPHTLAADSRRQSARCQSAHGSGSLHGLRLRGSLYGVPGGSFPSARYHQFTLGYRQSVRRSPRRIASSTCLCQSSASSLVGCGIRARGCRRTGVSAHHLGSPAIAPSIQCTSK